MKEKERIMCWRERDRKSKKKRVRGSTRSASARRRRGDIFEARPDTA